MTTLLCARCGYSGPFRICGDGQTIGRYYGENENGSIFCDMCCGQLDREAMIRDGRITLYLSWPSEPRPYRTPGTISVDGKLTNWPGTLSFLIRLVKIGRHNFAGRRFDVWFTGPDGKDWHGTQYGDNTQLCHCHRIKHRLLRQPATHAGFPSGQS